MEFERYLLPLIRSDLEKKTVLLSGPRQAGKTTLAKMLFPGSTEYLNYDSSIGRKTIREESWLRKSDLVIFDELHKMKSWKRWIKGIYDTEGVRPRILVTGSARLDLFRKGGDSLAGRFFLYRLHPLSIAEAGRASPSLGLSLESIQDRLMNLGPFPEPFLRGSQEEADRWRKTHLDSILREDLIDLESVRDLKGIETLVDLLSERVGSPVSFLSLSRDLAVSPNTVKHWIEILENFYVIFRVTPYSKNIAKALLKEPKIFFYDTGRVINNPGARFENMIATALIKRNHFLEDSKGTVMSLHYVRDQQKREVDFLTLKNKKPEFLVECKWNDGNLCSNLEYFSSIISPEKIVQLSGKPIREKQFGKIQVITAATWLAKLEA